MVELFPTLHQIGTNLVNNYEQWGEGRKAEIRADANMPPEKKPEELSKVDSKIAQINEHFKFLPEYRALPVRGRKGSVSTNA